MTKLKISGRGPARLRRIEAALANYADLLERKLPAAEEKAYRKVIGELEAERAFLKLELAAKGAPDE